MFTNGEDIVKSLSWSSIKKKKQVQKKLFFDLTEHEAQILHCLQQTDKPISMDNLLAATLLNSTEIASAILQLEIQHFIRVLPGKLVQLLDA